MKIKLPSLLTAVLALPGSAFAQSIFVVGGTTSVSLNTDLLASAAGLTLSGALDTVDAAPGFGGVGFTTVGFSILPTSNFTFTETTLAPFTGTIEHSGTVSFNGNTVDLGNFTIGFDALRVGDDRSGFFVQDTFSLGAILFDIAFPVVDSATESTLAITGSSLLVSAELGAFLVDQNLSAANLTGAVVGLAQINASAIPEPSSFAALAGLGALGLVALRRRRSAV